MLSEIYVIFNLISNAYATARTLHAEPIVYFSRGIREACRFPAVVSAEAFSCLRCRARPGYIFLLMLYLSWFFLGSPTCRSICWSHIGWCSDHGLRNHAPTNLHRSVLVTWSRLQHVDCELSARLCPGLFGINIKKTTRANHGTSVGTLTEEERISWKLFLGRQHNHVL